MTAVADRRDAGAPATGPAPSTLAPRAAWWRAYRHHLRLLRTQALVWIAAFAGIGAGITAAIRDQYSLVELAVIGAQIEQAPAFEALFGRTAAMDTYEGFMLWRWGGFAVLMAVVWGMLAGARLLRGEEDAGRVESLRAGLVTSGGLATSALAALGTVFALMAVAVGLSHTAVGIDAATAWALGGALALLAMLTAGLSALLGQLVGSRRTVLAVVGVVVAAMTAGRVVAASGSTGEWAWWANPLGWAGYLHEADEARGAVFALLLATAGVPVVAAAVLARRDLDGALLSRRGERAVRGRRVGGHLGLAFRLVAGPTVGWAVGVAAAGAVFGLMADDFSGAFAAMDVPVDVFEQVGFVGVDTPDGYAASMLAGFLVLLPALFAVSLAAAVRDEEGTWRIEHVLVRPVGRVAWLAGRALAAAVAVTVVCAAATTGTWAALAAIGEPMGLVDGLRATANVLPVPLLALAVGLALVAVLPRTVGGIGYALVVLTYLLDLVGALLDLPERVLDVSPFRHVAPVPVVDADLTAAGVMLGVAASLTVLAVVVLRARDLQEA